MKLLKIFPKRSLLIIGLLGAGMIAVPLTQLIFNVPDHGSSLAVAIKPTVVAKKVIAGLPVSLRIPAIDVDAPIESVGINSKGEMDTPTDPASTAWFNLGPRPGEVGSSVIDGHLDWFNGTPAVFENLSKLQKGDKLYVVDEDGTTITFVVREFGSYVQNQDATSVFRSVDGKAHLNLITCEGIWNQARQSYSNRLVVFANKES